MAIISKRLRLLRGFTLIELVVTMAILSLITGVTLANHNRFGGQIMLRNLAHEMALVIREAQVYGVSVRKVNIGVGEFSAGYGVHINAANPRNYYLFADSYEDSIYPVRGSDGLRNTSLEDVNAYTIGRGYVITQICAGSTGTVCANVCDSCSGGALDIVFERPEPDAHIRFSGVEDTLYDQAEITLTSPRGDTIRVVVEVSGQISVLK